MVLWRRRLLGQVLYLLETIKHFTFWMSDNILMLCQSFRFFLLQRIERILAFSSNLGWSSTEMSLINLTRLYRLLKLGFKNALSPFPIHSISIDTICFQKARHWTTNGLLFHLLRRKRRLTFNVYFRWVVYHLDRTFVFHRIFVMKLCEALLRFQGVFHRFLPTQDLLVASKVSLGFKCGHTGNTLTSHSTLRLINSLIKQISVSFAIIYPFFQYQIMLDRLP